MWLEWRSHSAVAMAPARLDRIVNTDTSHPPSDYFPTYLTCIAGLQPHSKTRPLLTAPSSATMAEEDKYEVLEKIGEYRTFLRLRQR
jgi:hypothetical protein